MQLIIYWLKGNRVMQMQVKNCFDTLERILRDRRLVTSDGKCRRARSKEFLLDLKASNAGVLVFIHMRTRARLTLVWKSKDIVASGVFDEFKYEVENE